jgi:hypothetical protein
MFLKSVAFVERNLDMTDKDKQVRELAEKLYKEWVNCPCGSVDDSFIPVARYILKNYVPRKRRRVWR